jgi:hypothetical protein
MSINASSQDLVAGVDFTGIASPEAADFNNGVDLARPSNAGSNNDGPALILTTTDTAANVPDVPNPLISADYAKWKRYQWNRRPFAGSAEKGITCYQWNDDAVNNATFIKWIEQFFDTTNIEATANNALVAANNAVTTANNANTLSGTANANAIAATTAATAAQNTATTAQTTADTGVANAATAQAAAVAAQTTANTALGIATKQSMFIKFSETKAKGTDAGASAAGKNTRVLNTTDWNGTTAPITLDPVTGLMTITSSGYYLIDAEATMYDNSDNQHQLFLVDNTTNNNILTGLSMYFVSGGGTTQRARVTGIALLLIGQTIRLDHYIANLQAANGLGRAANVNPDAGGKECYAQITLLLIGGN